MQAGLAEVLIGYRISPQTGPMVTLALGGTLAEIYCDAATRFAPVDRPNAFSMIEELKGLAPIRGYRGMPKGDCEALATAIINISSFALLPSDAPTVVEAEINPLMVKAEGQGVIAVDAMICLDRT